MKCSGNRCERQIRSACPRIILGLYLAETVVERVKALKRWDSHTHLDDRCAVLKVKRAIIMATVVQLGINQFGCPVRVKCYNSPSMRGKAHSCRIYIFEDNLKSDCVINAINTRPLGNCQVHVDEVPAWF